MKSKFLLSIALVICALNLFAQDRTFKSMGYDDATINGISGSLSYYIKIRPDDNVDGSSVVINLRASQVLNPNNSFVVVYLKDEAVYTQRVITSALDTLLSFRVPLQSKFLQPDGRYIKLRVAAKMSVGDEYCKDIENPACWIGVKNSSYISASSQTNFNYQRSIKEVIQEYNSVYTPAGGDVDDLMAGGLIYALLRQTAASKEVYTGTYSASDSLPQGVICGIADKLPYAVRSAMPAPSAGQGMIALVPVSAAGGTRYVIVVTGGNAEGYKKAINTLASNKRLSSAFSDKLIISEAGLSTEAVTFSSPLVTTLEDLGGGGSELMEGIGGLRKKFTFSLADFNAIPTKLTLHLESYFSTLKNDDRGFVNVYLNQNLIYNQNLADKANFINDIDLKPHLLSKFNALEVEFRFHPGSNVCKDGFSNFFAFINAKNSRLTFAGERETRFMSFFNFPAEFRKKQTKIVVSDALISSTNNSVVSSVGEVFYQLNTPLKADFNRLLVPQVVKSSAAGSTGDYNIIAIVNKTDAYANQFKDKVPVDFKADFQFYKGVGGAPQFSVNDFSSSGLAQIFNSGSNTILLVTALGDSGANGSSYLSAIKNFSTQLTEIQSNVCIANSNGKSNYFFKSPDDNSVVSYANASAGGLENFLSAYKFWILGVLLVLLVLGFFGMRNRVRKSTSDVV